ncbi:MAG: hypothetical protein R3E32_01410 [Chitinophagales bacterium]
MTVKEIKSLIDQDLDAAFEILDKYFEEDPIYNAFNDEFISPPLNFDKRIFCRRLQRFVQRNKELINAENEDKKFLQPDSSDQIYQLLCNLNFTSQVKYFKAIVKSKKPIIPFVIRAEQNYGQSWLYNRLIYHYQTEKPIHPPITIDLKSSQFNVSSLVQHLALNIGVKKYDESESIDVHRHQIKEVLLEKIETASQILIIKNVNILIHSEDFEAFVDIIDYFFTKIKSSTIHKCIFFFIEDELTIGDPYSQYCIFSSKTKAFQAKQEQLLKFIALTPIQALTNKCIEDWLGLAEEDICDCFNLEEKTIEQLLIDCGNGHPEKVLYYICREIGQEFDKHKSKWLKY